MTHLLPHARCALLTLSASLSLLIGSAALATPVPSVTAPKQITSPLLELEAQASKAQGPVALGTASGMSALNVVSRGRWMSACGIATTVLAHKVADVDALGVFALCAAIRNDTAAASRAVERLREAESVPYYGLLTQGILRLKEGEPEKAESAFKTVLRSRSGDPLALYFNAEALHARQKDTEAIAGFRSVLKSWPDHTPALTSAARLLAAPKATKEDLKEALAMTERATSIDPTNLANWRLLAALCDRTGQQDRANAIAVQWLSSPVRAP